MRMRLSQFSNASPRGRKCADENEFCGFRGQRDVYYGAGNRWVVQTLRNGILCSNNVFGDPAPNVRKMCYVARHEGSFKGPHDD